MQFQNPFNAQSVEPASTPPPIPEGEYKVVITASEPKPASTGKGGFLELTMMVIEGPMLNRTIPYRLNLFHENQQTVEISQRQLSALCHVTGQFMLQASEQLHNIPFVARIGPQRNAPEYSEVKEVKYLDGRKVGKGGDVAVAAPQQPQQPAAPQAQQPAPIWGAPPPAAPQPSWGPPPPQQQPQTAPAPAPPTWGSPAPAPQPQQWQPPAGGAPQQAAPPWANK